VTLDLHSAALDFAREVQELVDAVLPHPAGAGPQSRQIDVLHVRAAEGQEKERYAVQVGHEPKPGSVALLKEGRELGSLLFRFNCTYDSSRDYLAVEQSTVELHETNDRTPLLRLDFNKGANKVPTAHWNVHAERGSMSRLLARSNPEHVGLLSKVHLPVGGARMRPCLEDVLQLCLVEMDIDRCEGAIEAIEAGRERWRRVQTAALVRDAPDEAVRVLTELGYRVEEPADPAVASNSRALRTW
jgi:hypothetical protein